ncbi:MAG: YceI family protein [Actinomycetota bacterium]
MALPAPGTYQVDAVHSQVGFVVRHLVASKVRGLFTEFSGEIVIGDSAEHSTVHAVVQAASITTNNEMRDGHLKSPEFLDLENHPTLTLVSKSVTAKGDDHYALVTDLTLRGVTKEITFDLEFLGAGPGMAPNTQIAGFEATAEIDRRDFGANFEGSLENGSLVVANKVTLHLEIEASKEG